MNSGHMETWSIINVVGDGRDSIPNVAAVRVVDSQSMTAPPFFRTSCHCSSFLLPQEEIMCRRDSQLVTFLPDGLFLSFHSPASALHYHFTLLRRTTRKCHACMGVRERVAKHTHKPAGTSLHEKRSMRQFMLSHLTRLLLLKTPQITLISCFKFRDESENQPLPLPEPGSKEEELLCKSYS